ADDGEAQASSVGGSSSTGWTPRRVRASRSRISTWALTERSSAAANRSTAAITPREARIRNGFLFRAMSAVQGAGVDHRLGLAIRAQNDQQVGHHGGLAILIQFDHAALA